MARRSRVEIARSVLRLSGESLRSIHEFTAVAGAGAQTMIRWATAGKRGVFLDAVLDKASGEWFTSREAVSRFLVACDERQRQNAAPT